MVRYRTLRGPACDAYPLSIWIARGYPLTRAAHAKIIAQLEARDGER
jgi:Na+/melibiose symporter-like transporter